MDFKTIISEALETGESLDDIMAALAKAANEVEQERKEAEHKSDRQAVLDTIDKVLWDDIKTGTLGSADAAALITLIMANDTSDGLDFTPEEIVDFLEYTNFIINYMLDSWKIVKNTADAFKNIFGSLKDTGSKAANKSEEKKGNCGTDRETCHCKTPDPSASACKAKNASEPVTVKVHGPFDPADAEKIKNFLSNILG